METKGIIIKRNLSVYIPDNLVFNLTVSCDQHRRPHPIG